MFPSSFALLTIMVVATTVLNVTGIVLAMKKQLEDTATLVRIDFVVRLIFTAIIVAIAVRSQQKLDTQVALGAAVLTTLGAYRYWRVWKKSQAQ